MWGSMWISMIYTRGWKKPYRSTSEKTDSKWDTREAMNIPNSRFYYKTAISSRKECDFSSCISCQRVWYWTEDLSL